VFDALDAEFHFTLDAAATRENKKCAQYLDEQKDGLQHEWAPHRVWLNPPYGRFVTGKWIAKAHAEAKKGALVVALIPSRTSNRWFHEHILVPGFEVRFVKGRLRFGDAKAGAPFPSCVVVFDPRVAAMARVA
jgi:site-specific DNA-methyltransferase (adenine-specific)